MRIRTAVKAAVSLTAMAATAAGSYVVWAISEAQIDTVDQVAFDRPLQIPPLAQSRIDAHGLRIFDLTIQQGMTDLGRDELTETWGVNGTYLGPTLRASRGEKVQVNVTNELGVESTACTSPQRWTADRTRW
jgi:FtsP/CotA-like multicopper oxidase with cupredoxin domain